MPGTRPGIHVFLDVVKTWMAGTSPAMTVWLGSRERRYQRNMLWNENGRGAFDRGARRWRFGSPAAAWPF